MEELAFHTINTSCFIFDEVRSECEQTIVQLYDTLCMCIDKISMCYLAIPYEMADGLRSGSSIELLPLEGTTSAVWRHFGFPGRFSSQTKEAPVCVL